MNWFVFFSLTIVAILSIYIGYKIGIYVSAFKMQQQAFLEAKKEYLEFFHKRYTAEADTLITALEAELTKENEQLRREIASLKQIIKNQNSKH